MTDEQAAKITECAKAYGRAVTQWQAISACNTWGKTPAEIEDLHASYALSTVRLQEAKSALLSAQDAAAPPSDNRAEGR